MISLALPWVLGATAISMLAISALHFLSVRRPPALWLPTARFLPERDVRAVSRTTRPSDLPLLIVRLLLILLAGLAAAGIRWRPVHSTRLALVVIDRGVSRDTTATRALLRDVTVPMRFVFVDDTTATAPASRSVFSRSVLSRRDDEEPARVFPVAWRAAARAIAADAAIESIDLHLLLAHAPNPDDEGWTGWRAAWPGRVTVRSPPSAALADSAVRARRHIVIVSDASSATATNEDPVLAAFAWHAERLSQGNAVATDTVFLVRGADSLRGVVGARSGSVTAGRTTVYWPRSGVPASWRRVRSTAGTEAGTEAGTDSSDWETSTALIAGGRAMIGQWRVVSEPDTTASDATRAIAWWNDGRVAATEDRDGGSCDRSVAVIADASSDALLSDASGPLFARLLARCDAAELVPTAQLTVRASSGGAAAASTAFEAPRGSAAVGDGRDGLGAWLIPALLVVALGLLVVEWRQRDRVEEPTR